MIQRKNAIPVTQLHNAEQTLTGIRLKKECGYECLVTGEKRQIRTQE